MPGTVLRAPETQARHYRGEGDSEVRRIGGLVDRDRQWRSEVQYPLLPEIVSNLFSSSEIQHPEIQPEHTKEVPIVFPRMCSGHRLPLLEMLCQLGEVPHTVHHCAGSPPPHCGI